MSDINVTVTDFPINITVSEGIITTSGGSGTDVSFVTGVSGVLQKQISDSGAYLLSQIQISNAGVNSLNELSGILSLTGLGGVTISNNGNIITISGNNSSVINLSGINNIAISQSGQVYYVSGVNLITSNQTGQFYPASNPQFYLKSGEALTITDSGNIQSQLNFIQNQPVVTGISILGSTQHLTGYVTFSAANSDVSLGQNATSIIISVPGLQTTGTNLQNQINSIKSGTGNFITGFNSGLYTLNSQTGNYTGLFVTRNETGQFTGSSIITNNNFFVNSGSGLFVFQTNIQSGIDKQFINFPTSLGNNPTIINSLKNNNIGDIISYQTSGTINTGYWILFSETVNDTGYILNTFAANSTGTGLATIIINNITINSGNINSIGTAVTGLSINGLSSMTGLISITGIGNVQVFQQGNTIQISGISFTQGGTLPFAAGLVNINSGDYNSQFIQFSQNFNSIPNVIGNIINNNGDPLIAYNISGTSSSGFYLNLSDILITNNYYFDYLATTGAGFYNFALSLLSTASNIINNGTITGGGSVGYLPQFNSNGTGLINSVVSGASTGIYISGSLNVNAITVPNANFRIQNGQIQFWDSVAFSGDNSRPWRALGVYDAMTLWSDPILD